MGPMLLVLGLFSLLGQAYGQYMSLNITAPFECGALTVQWWGDDGPYHLLVTPTEIRQHSYNVWVPTIDNGTNTYTMTLRQPAGLPFMVTVWGRSGIQFAGSSDIYTVGPATTSNSSCFLTDQEILERYSFSFNITGSNGGFPPQCTNLTMSWPTSLEQSVLGTVTRRDLDSGMDYEGEIENGQESVSVGEERDYGEQSLYPPPGFPRLDPFPMTGLSARSDRDLSKRQDSNPSSSTDSGNTTNPPTMFGLIPLGNSFSLPITYPANSSFADSLPETSISSEPTTFTRQGVTYLNWTLPLSKGTRFILVAGIGTAEQWASGGSSRLLTVGQGDESCLGSSYGDGPSVTANPTNTDAIPTATRPPDDGSTPAPPATKSNSNLVRIVLACVISIVGTLMLVLAFWFYKRWRRQRESAPSLPGKKGRVDPFAYDPNVGDRDRSATDTQLDLLGRDGLRLDTSRSGSPIHTIHGRAVPVPLGSGSGSPTSPNDPFRTPNEGRQFSYPYTTPLHTSGGPSRSSTLDNMSPLGQGSTINRISSQEALLSHATASGTGTGTNTMTPTSRSQTRRLGLHDGFLDEGDEEEPTDLKRETLAALEGPPGSAGTGTGTGTPTRPGTGMGMGIGTGTGTGTGTRSGMVSPTPNTISSNRRRRRQDEEYETEYVVHQDAGRVDRVELPPRYDQVQWDER